MMKKNVLFSLMILCTGILLAQSPTHNLYFGDRSDTTLSFVNLQTPETPIAVKMAGVSRMYGICVEPSLNKVFMSDYYNYQIMICDLDGANPEVIVETESTIDGPYGLTIASGKVYWAMLGGIWSANFDGTEAGLAIDLTATPKDTLMPLDMDYVAKTGKIYFVNDKEFRAGGIWSVNPDGTELTEILANVDGTAIEVDPVNEKIYYAVYDNALKVCGIDGSSPTTVGDVGSKATWGIEVDLFNNKLYWGVRVSNGNPDGKIVQSNLDGTGAVDFITNVNPYALYFDAPTPDAIHTLNLEMVQIYPNPAQGTIHISAQKPGNVTIYDVTGKLVKSATMLNTTMDLNISDLQPGCYYVKTGNQKASKLMVQ